MRQLVALLILAVGSVACLDPSAYALEKDGGDAGSDARHDVRPDDGRADGRPVDSGGTQDARDETRIPPADTGADAEPSDAGSAGDSTDAGAEDSGTTDTGVGPWDSDSPDTGIDPSDSGAHDAGVPDAGHDVPLTQRSCPDPGERGCGVVGVPGGSFSMGEGSPAFYATPTHPVTVEGFAIDAYEVTVARFRRFWSATPVPHPVPGSSVHYPGGADLPWTGSVTPPSTADADCNWSSAPGSRESHPINCVDWYTAQAFCVWDGGRLPTEAEWEHAARGRAAGSLPSPRAYPWGNEEPGPSCDRARWNGPGCAGDDGTATRRVGSFAGQAGIHDQAGNVWEWTADHWTVDYGDPSCWGTSPRMDPLCQGGTSGVRTVRGGAWPNGVAGMLRSATRGGVVATGLPPGAYYSAFGLRCVRSP